MSCTNAIYRPYTTQSTDLQFTLDFCLAFLSLGLRHLQRNFPLALGILGIILIEIALVLARPVPTSAWAVPKVKRLAMHTIRRRDDLEQITARNFDGGNLRCGESDEVRQQASDDRGVTDDQQVLFLALKLDEDGFETDCMRLSKG